MHKLGFLGDLLFTQLRRLTSDVLLEFREINKVGHVRTCWARVPPLGVCTPPHPRPSARHSGSLQIN